MNENTQIFPTDYAIIRAWMDLNYFWKGRRISKKRKKKLDKVKESKKNLLGGDKSFIIWSYSVARLEKLHDNKQHRLSFEQASSSILFFDFSATLPALVFFLPSSGSHHSAWPSGIYPEPPTRRISSSDVFWFHFLFFFFWFLWFHSRFVLESHAFGIQGGMPAMRATGTCRETHTWGEDGSTNTVSCKNKKGEKGLKGRFPSGQSGIWLGLVGWVCCMELSRRDERLMHRFWAKS